MLNYHISTRINSILLKSDDSLQQLFGINGTQVRKDLEKRLSNGELLINSDNCIGFCPITGCPGHAIIK